MSDERLNTLAIMSIKFVRSISNFDEKVKHFFYSKRQKITVYTQTCDIFTFIL